MTPNLFGRFTTLALTLLSLANAHPSSSAEGAWGELKFETDAELPAETALQGWFEVTTLKGQPVAAKDCLCTLLVYQGAATATAKPVVQTALDRPDRFGFSLIFPRDGPHTVVLLGRPRPGSGLEPFKLTYLVNVLPVR